MLQVRRAQSVILLFWILNWLSCQHLNCPANSVDFFKTENNLKWPTRHISFYSFISMVGQNPMQLWERVPDWEWLRFFFLLSAPDAYQSFQSAFLHSLFQPDQDFACEFGENAQKRRKQKRSALLGLVPWFPQEHFEFLFFIDLCYSSSRK